VISGYVPWTCLPVDSFGKREKLRGKGIRTFSLGSSAAVYGVRDWKSGLVCSLQAFLIFGLHHRRQSTLINASIVDSSI